MATRKQKQALSKDSHGAVEFVVTDADGRNRYFDTFAKAAVAATMESLRLGQKWTNLNVIVHSEAGAHWWGGDVAVERYREYPEASIFEQLAIKVESRGMIP
ncbi:MAG: hypothetical protein A3E01_07925 [Gammaproteobacteria bacterium RIFCSPHIGHO2_12_FULL_63_22]|nr:MAG: hypothetical protein A3E01_07925 [Gammaproteobacteria bacterium RIFCSPHIGHO2_12_FULL_63_22]